MSDTRFATLRASATAARPVYATLRGYATPAGVRTATLEGREHLVCPVVVMVADSVVSGLHSKGPEYVPAAVLAVAPFGLDGRPVVYAHPESDSGSANDPSTQNAARYGQVFNAHIDPDTGNLCAEVWIDLDRADLLGEETQQVVADVRAGKLIEVSLGAWIAMAEEEGEAPDGTPYEWIWQLILSHDHLAVGLGGEGACSVEMGCGMPRYQRGEGGRLAPKSTAATPAVIPTASGITAVSAALALSKARRPTFSGTETSTWSAPSWHEWVTALHTGATDTAPSSIAQATPALKAAIARHTILGDPNADTLRDLTLFAVVNPHSGKLNKRALNAVLGGRGSQADIPDAARTSAQTMARDLLKSEFGVEPEESEAPESDAPSADVNAKESANMAETPTVGAATATPATNSPAASSTPSESVASPRREGLMSRFLSFLGGLGSLSSATSASANAGSTEGMSHGELRSKLSRALSASEPGYGNNWYFGDGIVDVWPDTQTVVYQTCPEDDILLWQQTYTIGADGEVILNGDRERVEYRPVPVSTEDAAAEGEGEGGATGNGEGADDMPMMTAAATAVASPAPCGCKTATAAAPLSTNPSTAASGEGDPSTVANPTATTPTPVQALAARLVACGKFTAADTPVLESMTEATLTVLCEKFAPTATPAATTATTPALATATAPAPSAAPATLDDWIVTAHPDAVAMFNRVREMDARQQAAEAAHRKSVTAAILTAQRSTVYTAEKLAKLSMPDLLDVAAVVGVSANTSPLAPLALTPSYLGLGLPTPPDASPEPQDDGYVWQNGYDIALAENGKPTITPGFKLAAPAATPAAKAN